MRVRSALKLAAIAALALTVSLVAAVKSMDFNRTKGVLADQVRAATGRELVIAGPLELRLGLVPRVIASGVTLTNAPGGSRAEMIKIERIEAEVSLLPLLKRQIRVNRLIVSAPDILVETDAKGRGNWEFTPTGSAPAAAADGVPSSRFTLREVRIKNGTVTWRDGRSGQTQTLILPKLAIQPDQTGAGPLAVQMVGEYQSKGVELSGRVGAPSAGKPWPLQLKGSLDGLVLVVDGSIADPLAGRGLDIKLTAQGDELGKAAALAGLTPPGAPLPLGPFKLSAHLGDPGGIMALTDLDVAVGKRDSLVVSARGTVRNVLDGSGVELVVGLESDNLAGLSRLTGTTIPSMGPLKLTGSLSGGQDVWKLADIKATLAGSDATGEMSLQTGRRPRLTGKLIAGSLALTDFITPASKPGEKQPPKHIKPAGDGRIFPATPLPLQDLRAMDAHMDLHVRKLDVGGLRLTNADATVQLTGGRLALKPVRALLAGGQVEGEAVFDASGKAPDLALRLVARQIDLGLIMKDNGSDALTGGRTDARLDLRGKGDNIRALMASASGEVLVNVGEGRLQNKAVDWAGGDLIFQVLGALNPLNATEDTTALSCGIVRFVVRDGLAASAKGVAVETTKVNVVGAGTIDLRSEAVDMGITQRARDGIGLSLSSQVAGMTRIRGTLGNPVMGVDELGTARAAASVGAAMATGGLSLLGELLVDKITADSSPCQTALGKSTVKPAPKPAAKKPAAKKNEKKGGGPLEGLFGR